jgi:hypothetical protein
MTLGVRDLLPMFTVTNTVDAALAERPISRRRPNSPNGFDTCRTNVLNARERPADRGNGSLHPAACRQHASHDTDLFVGKQSRTRCPIAP